ncbi:hypothetical protein [Corynebacterium variabile]|uniref:hypothetical protein n=1 Tax=Corynebacterium variabile TaxID=1727 RepID=UPI003A95DCC8
MRSTYTAKGLRIALWILLSFNALTILGLSILSEIYSLIELEEYHATGLIYFLTSFSKGLIFTSLFCIIVIMFSGTFSQAVVKISTIVGFAILFLFTGLNIAQDLFSYRSDWDIYTIVACVIALPAVIMHLVVIIVACVSRPRDSASQVVYPTPQTTQPMPQQYSPQQPTYQPWN